MTNWTEVFKANLVRPVWTRENPSMTEIPFIVQAIDSCIGDNWRKEVDINGTTNERIFDPSNHK